MVAIIIVGIGLLGTLLIYLIECHQQKDWEATKEKERKNKQYFKIGNWRV